MSSGVSQLFSYADLQKYRKTNSKGFLSIATDLYQLTFFVMKLSL